MSIKQAALELYMYNTMITVLILFKDVQYETTINSFFKIVNYSNTTSIQFIPTRSLKI